MITAVIMAHDRAFILSNIHDSLCRFGGGLESYLKLLIHTPIIFFFFFLGEGEALMYYNYLKTPNFCLN